MFQLTLNQWTVFTQECGIIDNKSTGIRASDLDRMFLSTNYEEQSNSQASEANNDDALVR